MPCNRPVAPLLLCDTSPSYTLWILDMRVTASLHTVCLLIAALFILALGVAALEDVQAPLQAESIGNQQGKPKLFKPKTGIMKEEHDVDPGNQRARADDMILENAEEYQPESERVIDSLEDLSLVIVKNTRLFTTFNASTEIL